MKKKLILLLSILFVLSLFAGCGGDNTAPSTVAPVDDQGTSEDAANAPEEDDSPYNYAAGKFETNEKGFPVEPYEYELPLTTTGETLSFWTTVFTPQYLPEEGYGGLEYAIQLEEMTGVVVEYVIVPSESRKENYSIMQASDDLCDILSQAIFFSSDTYEKNLEDGWWVNIYDYKDYCPNYIYQATFDPKDQQTYESVFYKEDKIVTFHSMLKDSVIAAMYTARGDWLAEMGKTNDDIVTIENLHEMLTYFKANFCEYPLPLFGVIDMAGCYFFTCYDTLPAVGGVGPVYQINGEVQFANSTERDKELMITLNQWFTEKLIDPDWTSFTSNQSYANKTVTGQVGMVFMSPGEVTGYEQATTNDEDCTWVPLHKPLKYPGQVIHLGGETARVSYGSSCVSASCENIELAITWCDFRYSPYGSFYASYGPEGVLWEKDENGNPTATEWALNHPEGLSYAWACMLYGINSLAEHGLEDGMRKYAYPGGKRLEEMHYYWDDYDYDGAYEWPVGVNFTEDQTAEVNKYMADLVTYISENYLGFVDGSKPLSEWDAYVSGLYELGWNDILAVYQEAYDTYIAEQAA